MRISPSSAVRSSTPGNAVPQVPTLFASVRPKCAEGPALCLAPALDQRQAEVDPELNKLRRYRSPAGNGHLV